MRDDFAITAGATAMREDAELDVDALMREIRAELAERPDMPSGRYGASTQPGVHFQSPASAAAPIRLSRLGVSAGTLSRQSQYELKAFLAFQDEDFVRNAYVLLLGREPDTEGASRYLTKLRNGDLAKVEVLGRIRFSPEGRAAGVKVRGLVVPFGLRTLRRVPVLGYAVGIAHYVLRLPTVVRNLERLEAVVFLHRLEHRREVNKIETEIESALVALHDESSVRMDSTDNRLVNVESNVQHWGELVESLSFRLKDKADRGELVELNRRLQIERNAQNEQLTSLLQRIERDKADRHALHELAQLQEAASAGQRHLLERLGELGTLVDVAQASAVALEQGKADRTQMEVWIGQVATEILELRGMAASSAADVGDARSAISQTVAEIGEVRAAVTIVENRIAEQTSAALVEGSMPIVESPNTVVRQINVKLEFLRDQLARYQREMSEQERRLSTLLDEVRQRAPGQSFVTEQLATFAHEQDHLLDNFYLAFEDRFRGTREDIAQRVEIYVPYIRKVSAGSASAPVLDLGCGRGEWLEVLAGHDLVGQGVDSNRLVAAFCRERGISVIEADALEHLRTLPTGSVGAITAIHVVEHLPFTQMLALFDEARRVLRTGGVAIFETPNPENVVVGACNFYYDPTHVRPLPPEPLSFVLSQRGFADVELLRLHPRHDAPAPDANARPLDLEVEQRFYGAQDYAVIGYKRTAA